MAEAEAQRLKLIILEAPTAKRQHVYLYIGGAYIGSVIVNEQELVQLHAAMPGADVQFR